MASNMESVDSTKLSHPERVFESVPLKEHIDLNSLRTGDTWEIDEARCDQVQKEEDGERELYQKFNVPTNLPDFSAEGEGMGKLTADGGVVKSLLQRGMGRYPANGDVVKVHYAAYVQDLDEPYDDSWLRGKPCFFHISKEEVPTSLNMIPGFHIAIKTMQKLEFSEFIIRYDYAYGKLGSPPRIPKKATVRFMIEMLDILDRKDSSIDDGNDSDNEDRFLDLKNVSVEQVIRKVDDVKKLCKSLLEDKRPNYHQAWRHYRYALNLLVKCSAASAREQELVEDYLQALYTNMALCLYKECKYMGAASAAQQAIKINSNNQKAHYWLGKSHLARNNLEIARKHLVRARNLTPEPSSPNPDIQKAFRDLEIRQKEAVTTERSMCSKMFGFKKPEPTKTDVPVAKKIIEDDKRVREVSDEVTDEEMQELLKNVSPEFQTMIIEKLSAFENDNTQTTLSIPKMSMTQGELVCLVNAAENMNLGVDFNVQMNCIIVSKVDD